MAFSPLPRGSAMLLVLPALADRLEDMIPRPGYSDASNQPDSSDSPDLFHQSVGPDWADPADVPVGSALYGQNVNTGWSDQAE